MELVQAAEIDANSGDETKMTKNVVMTETLQKIKALSFDSRDRKKSKYLSYPYINLGPGNKGLPVKTEDSQTPHLSHNVEGSSVATNNFNGSPSTAKSCRKRFRRNWYRKFVRWSTLSSSPEFINASSAQLLSGLYSKAVGCMFPIESKSFDLVEWFFCRYRLSKYQDEAELTASLVNVKGRNSGIPVRNDSLDINTEQKRRNKKNLEYAVRNKTKYLSGLSYVNRSIATGEFLLKGCMEMNTRGPGGKVEEVIPSLQLQNVGTTTLNGSRAKCSSLPEGTQFVSCLTSENTAGHKKRKKTVAAPEHLSSQIFSGSLDLDGKSTKCSSLFIDLQMMSPPINGIPEKSNGENKEELGLIGSDPELYASQPGLVGNTANSLLVSTTSVVGVASVNKTLLRRRKRKEEAPVEHLKTKLATGIPDLNDSSTEYNSIKMELEDVSGISPELNPKYDKRNQNEPNTELSRSISAGMGLTQTVNYNIVEAKGEAHGTCLLLQFDPRVSLPSKEDLLATFCRFGPLKVSETQLLKDGGRAQVVFVRSADAGEAYRSIELNKPFGATLIDCKLHFSATIPPVERCVTSTLPSGSKPLLSQAPPLDFIRRNLLMMTSILEKSGDKLSPQMRDKLKGEIKDLLNKVNSMAGSFSIKV